MGGYHDIIVGAKTRIDEPHEQVHKGISFTVQVNNTIMEDAETLIVAFCTGDKEVHLTYDLNVAWGGNVAICENPTWDEESGTPTRIVNKNRKFNVTSTIKTDEGGIPGYVLKDPTGYTCNTQQFGTVGLGLLWFFKPTDLSRSSHNREFVLKENTKYGIVYTAAVADGWWATDAAQIIMDWYEIDNKFDDKDNRIS